MKNLIAALICLFLAIPCNARIITVDDDGPADFDNIQAAIDDANDGDVVLVAPGTYTGPGNRDISFLGKAITVQSIDPFDPNVVEQTVVDCQASKTNLHRGFYFHHGEGSDSVLAGLTITKGYHHVGGGIYCESSPMIHHCTITGNTARNYAGGIRVSGGSPTISHCTIKSNRIFPPLYKKGGGIHCSGTPFIYNCVIKNNSAHYGSGVYCSGGNPTLSNCIITGNWVAYDGGGVYCNASANIINCTIARNTSYANGDGIYCNQGVSTIRNCIIWDNDGPEVAGSGFDLVYSDIQGGWPGEGNINFDPLFVDPGSGDYHLSANSFCINSGDPTYTPDPCKTDIDGEPRVINGRTDIGADEFNYEGPILASYPTEFSFSAYTLGPNPAPQTLTIRNNGSGTLNWEIVENCPWLEIGPDSGESTGEIDEVNSSVDISGMSLGLYNCELTVNASGVFNSPQTVLVTLDVFEPVIEINPEQIEFLSPKGQRHPDDQFLNIFNSGTGTLAWRVSADCNWLEVNPSSGESTGGIDQVTLAANITNLDPGIYSCTLTVDSNYASNTPKIVPVTLHVHDPYINYTPASFDLFMVKGESPPANQVLAISNGGGSTLIWEIDANCSWIQATPTAGETTDETDEVVLSLDTDELEPGSYSCIVTISATNATNSPQIVPVTLYVHSEGVEILHVPTQFPTIQRAIDIALDGDTVIVAEGTYTGDDNRDLDFGRKAITVRSIDPNDPNVVAATIIDCNGTEAQPHRGFYFHRGEDVNSILNGLTIKNGYAYDGGGIYCNSSSPTIANCNFIDCSAEDWGGGIYCYKSSPLISNCTFIGNSAFEGGAVTTYYYGHPVIENCTIIGNTASGSGGGINSDSLTTPTISNCAIIGNFAGHYGGGGISIFQSNPTITNCTVADNSTDNSGGGILQWYEFENGSTITNCTITSNTATNHGGGIYGDRDCEMTLTNCTLWGNKAADGNQLYLEDESVAWVSYSDVQGGQVDAYIGPSCVLNWGEGNINAAPRFIFSRDYHLMPDSPCIDAGTNTPIGGLPSTDIDGNPRPLDGNSDGTAVADIGAYEYNPNSPSIAVSASALSFSYVPGWADSAPQTLLIRNCGGGTLHWQIVEGCNWLQAAPTNGISNGQINEVTLTVDPNGLAISDYHCILRVLDPNVANSPVTILVTLHVGEILRVPDDFFTIQAAIDAADDYDMVLVADGTYTGEGNRDIDFLGKAIIVRSENGPESCIIDCNGTEHEPHRGFYFHKYEDTDSILEGFTITNGYGPGEPTPHGIASCGGAIYCINANPTISNCTISGNSVSGRGGRGGGIYCEGGSPTIKNCNIMENQGDGIHCRDSSPTIKNCKISENRDGRGIYCENGSPTITKCTIRGNSAGADGSGISCRGFGATITDCIISDNVSWGRGAGGGISIFQSICLINNCTITGNIANKGGGIRYGDSSMTLTNCILWGNEAQEGPEIYLWGSYGNAWVSYTDVQGGWSGEGNINADPMFFDANNPDPNLRDYHLRPGSPCIDAGDNWAVPADTTDLDGDGNTTEPIPWDLDGNSRIVDGNDDGIAVVDMGAYEFFNTSPIADAGPNQVAYAWIDNIAEVVLDGNDSNDPDGDELTYLWSWTIGPTTYETNSVSPAIELPVGEHIIELIVNDGTEDSEPDEVTITVIEPMESHLWIFPQVINRRSRQRRIGAWLRLPEGVTRDQIDSNEPLLLYPNVPEANGIEAIHQYVFQNRRRRSQRTSILAFFDKAELMDAVGDDGSVELQVVGNLRTGQYFYGTDTVWITDRRWLRALRHR